MDSATETGERADGVAAAEQDERFAAAKREGGGDEGREMVAHAAMGAELSRAEEKSALDWMLAGPVDIEHVIPVEYETPAGMAKLTFVTRMLDSRRVDEIQQRHINTTTGRIDKLTADIEIVAAATKYLTDASGRRIDINGDEYATARRRDAQGETVTHRLASPADALEYHFKGQEGLLSGLSNELQKIAGYTPERIGAAQRRLVDASLG